jgi:hypothetical protein
MREREREKGMELIIAWLITYHSLELLIRRKELLVASFLGRYK